MDNNYTNINKANNHLPPQIIKNDQAQKCGGLHWLMEAQPPLADWSDLQWQYRNKETIKTSTV